MHLQPSQSAGPFADISTSQTKVAFYSDNWGPTLARLRDSVLRRNLVERAEHGMQQVAERLGRDARPEHGEAHEVALVDAAVVKLPSVRPRLPRIQLPVGGIGKTEFIIR